MNSGYLLNPNTNLPMNPSVPASNPNVLYPNTNATVAPTSQMINQIPDGSSSFSHNPYVNHQNVPPNKHRPQLPPNPQNMINQPVNVHQPNNNQNNAQYIPWSMDMSHHPSQQLNQVPPQMNPMQPQPHQLNNPHYLQPPKSRVPYPTYPQQQNQPMIPPSVYPPHSQPYPSHLPPQMPPQHGAPQKAQPKTNEPKTKKAKASKDAKDGKEKPEKLTKPKQSKASSKVPKFPLEGMNTQEDFQKSGSSIDLNAMAGGKNDDVKDSDINSMTEKLPNSTVLKTEISEVITPDFLKDESLRTKKSLRDSVTMVHEEKPDSQDQDLQTKQQQAAALLKKKREPWQLENIVDIYKVMESCKRVLGHRIKRKDGDHSNTDSNQKNTEKDKQYGIKLTQGAFETLSNAMQHHLKGILESSMNASARRWNKTGDSSYSRIRHTVMKVGQGQAIPECRMNMGMKFGPNVKEIMDWEDLALGDVMKNGEILLHMELTNEIIRDTALMMEKKSHKRKQSDNDNSLAALPWWEGDVSPFILVYYTKDKW
jgi:hypothetical protein